MPACVRERLEEADDDGVPRASARDELRGRRAHAHEAVGVGGDWPVDELGARLGVGVVAESGGRAGAAFDPHLEPVAELRHGLGDERDAALAGSRLLRNSDAHAAGELYGEAGAIVPGTVTATPRRRASCACGE